MSSKQFSFELKAEFLSVIIYVYNKRQKCSLIETKIMVNHFSFRHKIILFNTIIFL